MTVSRRSLLYLGALLIVSLLLLRWRTTLKNLLFRPETEAQFQPPVPNPFVEGNKALAGLVHGEDVELMVREATGLIGGLDKIDVKGRTVLVKPNIVAAEPSPTTTSPEVVGAVVKLLREAGAKRIYVGDMSALLTLPTKKNMERTGILEAARRAGAEPLFFEEHRWVKVELPQAKYIREAHVSEWIYKADRIVNVPVIKTHRNAVYSVALKNFIGATHGRQRPYLVDPRHWEEIVAELNLAYQPHLNVVDGTRVMVSGGPWSGEEKRAGIVIASGDRVAADAVSLGVIKHYGRSRAIEETGVWEQRQIKRAVELGLGAKDPTSIALRTKSLKPNANFELLISAVQKHVFRPN